MYLIGVSILNKMVFFILFAIILNSIQFFIIYYPQKLNVQNWFCSPDSSMILILFQSGSEYKFYINLDIIDNVEKQNPLFWGKYKIEKDIIKFLSRKSVIDQLPLEPLNHEMAFTDYQLDPKNCSKELFYENI